MSDIIKNCLKCGGVMKVGDIRVDVPATNNAMSAMNPMNTFNNMQTGQPSTVYPYWEEKTGKKGFLGRETTAILNIKTFRCTLCGFIEFYVKQ